MYQHVALGTLGALPTTQAAYGVKNAGFHGYLPHEGPRRAVQVNYQTRFKQKNGKYVYPNNRRVTSGKMTLPPGVSLTSKE